MFGTPARSRLLPMSVPFRYFGAAVAFQVAAWALLVSCAGDLPAFEGGLGPVFASLHLVTLGVVAMTAIGATLQLLPVATRQPVRSVAAAKAVWWLLVPGIAILSAGAAAYAPRWMAPGAVLAAFALAIYAWLLAANLRAARGMKVVVAHGWAAVACLALLLASGLALVAHFEHGLALDHMLVRRVHLVLATYGFMGFLALGLSQFLLPMFAVAPPPEPRWAYAWLAMAVAGMLLALVGLAIPAVLAGLAAVALHVFAMERSLRARLRPMLDPAFLLIRISWLCLASSLVLAGFIAAGSAPPNAAALFGLLLVPGWLMTFLLGVLQRIVPFLASVHSRASLASALTPAMPLAVHRVLHLCALAFLVPAVAFDVRPLAEAGAALGFAGAAAFAAFYVQVLWRRHKLALQPPDQPATA